jgi:hypothetical protein
MLSPDRGVLGYTNGTEDGGKNRTRFGGEVAREDLTISYVPGTERNMLVLAS